jgi:hypothetical protein
LPGAGAGAPATGQPTTEAARAAEAPLRARWRRGGGHAGHALDISGDLEEEKAGLLLLEVRSCLSRGRMLDKRGCDTLFSCLQGDGNRAPPRTGQDAEGGCVRPHQAVLTKGDAGGCRHGGGSEWELARRG